MASPTLSELVNLLRQATTLRVVGDFLKAKEIPYSAKSWEEMEQERLQPAIERGQLSMEELIALLDEVEDFGRFHVLLYHCSEKDAKSLLELPHVTTAAKSTGLSAVMHKPAFALKPGSPTVTGIRHQSGAGGSLSIKIVETRRYEELVDVKTRKDITVRRYRTVEARAVNVFRLSSTGLLEVRIWPQKTAARYSGLVDEFWVDPVFRFFPRNHFQPFHLNNLKNKLWETREELRDVLRFSDTRMRNDAGYTLAVASPKRTSNLCENTGAVTAVDGFCGKGGFPDSSNIWWTRQPDGIPAADIHVLLSGEPNEFILTANCTKAEYEYVLTKLAYYGR